MKTKTETKSILDIPTTIDRSDKICIAIHSLKQITKCRLKQLYNIIKK